MLLKNGVPASAIIRENKSGHTRDNAFLSRKPYGTTIHFTFPGELVHLFDKETERNLLAD